MAEGTFPRALTDAMPSMAGGLNELATPLLYRQDQYFAGENIRFNTYGEIERRCGAQHMLSAAIAAQPVRGVFSWRLPTSAPILVVCNGVLYSSGSYAIPLTLTNKGAIGSATAYPSFAAFRDGAGEVCYIADGVGLRKIDTAGTHSAVVGPPALSQIAVYNQRLFGITGSDQTIYFSSLNNGDSCGVASATSGSAIVRTFGSQKLTALCTLKNSLAMFHVSGISRFTGLTQDDIAIGAGSEGISVDTGTIAPRSIVPVEGAAYFLSERGAFRVTDDGVEPLDRPDFPDPLVGWVSAASAQYVCAAHDRANRTIRWHVGGRTISYSYRWNVWVGYDDGVAHANVYAMCDAIDSDSRPVVITADGSGHLYVVTNTGIYLDGVDASGSGGTAFQMRLGTRYFFGADPGRQKSWARARIHGRFVDSTPASMSSTLSWTTNLVTGSSATGITPPPGVAGAFNFLSVPIDELGSWIILEYTDTSESLPAIARIDVEYFEYGARR